MEEIIKVKRHINTDNNPLYFSKKEYETILYSKGKILAYTNPELTTPYIKFSKKVWFNTLDVILKEIK